MAARLPFTPLLAPLHGTDGRIQYISLERAEALGLCAAARLPLTLKILLECSLRHAVDPAALDLSALADRPRRGSLDFRPTRLLLQDFTGVPLMTDLASLRDATARRGYDPSRVNPRIPIDFVCDHALIAVHGGRPDAMALNEKIEIERNRERFEFLKWCAGAFSNIRLIPPGSGIMHQLNLEWLSTEEQGGDNVRLWTLRCKGKFRLVGYYPASTHDRLSAGGCCRDPGRCRRRHVFWIGRPAVGSRFRIGRSSRPLKISL